MDIVPHSEKGDVASDIVSSRQAIENGVVDINEGKSNGVTLMDTAVSNNQFEVVKMFLEKRAKLDQQT